jgi:aminomethyltransferase
VRERVYQHLDHFIIADDVTLKDATDRLAALSVEGPAAAEVLSKVGAPIPDLPYSHVDWNGRIVARLSSTGASGFRIFAPREQIAALTSELAAAGIPQVDAASARVVRLEHSRPRYGEDITETTLPQETQQAHALHFSKGCYIGQEIVERIRSRGHVNRLLMGLRIDATTAPDAGTKITAGGADIGEITSAAFSPAFGKVVALGILRAQYAVPGTSVQAGDAAAITTPPAGAPEADRVPTAGC